MAEVRQNWRWWPKHMACWAVPKLNRALGVGIGPAETIVMAGVPRGGTTWLAELIFNLPDTTMIWEPLHLDTLGLITDLSFDWRQHIPEDADWPQAADFMRRLVSGRVMHPIMFRPKDYPRPGRRFYFTKFCRANRLLAWLVKHVPMRPPVYLVRHPCAVVASQQRHGSWGHVPGRFHLSTRRYAEVYEPYRPILETLGTQEEVLTADWCLDQLFTLRHLANNRAWISVAYERLVTAGEAELHRIFARLGLPTPPAAITQLNRPSRMTKPGSPILSGGDQLSGWTRKLNPDQVRRVIGVVERFGLTDIYTDALEPNYGAIYSNEPAPAASCPAMLSPTG